MKDLRDAVSRLKGGAPKAEGGVSGGHASRDESMKAESMWPAHYCQGLLSFQSYRPGLFTRAPGPGRAAGRLLALSAPLICAWALEGATPVFV